MSNPKHFLDLDRLDAQTLRRILDLGGDLKRARAEGGDDKPLHGKTLAMIFEKPSTRTRVSFEVGMVQLGGHVVILGDQDSQLGRGETVADTARVLSRYVNAIMIRTDDPQKLVELEQHADIPVINGLTDRSHPCQLMADIMTYEEHRGPIAGRTVAWCGDGNNMAVSYIHAAVRFGFALRLACPEALAVPADVLAWAAREGGDVTQGKDADAACADADLIVTDTWVSMGDEDAGKRHNMLQPFQIDARRMALAKDDALFMHCLPAHRGEEVTAEVIDGPRSVIWDEAENRLHAQKGILAWCLS
ncbi:ornithine carbamoyltransferase [Varunaivibrio sulfuroxidans]|uniref:Ornithine carbamoyltransferase n=1 Tax=Varunaivibrio sulfuroxidans TaxID=1773489 RepID=A0A4V2UP95_9PROT|nr:ornithine carbamoyltransferase [Varunaivibrio sulfuroxidans]TCS64971.1 ornithine carbamoyltransferase [Varunaivibrio sulfuroxidans]WES29737.1 ornithine carbamoyltransferase [Varunaivibrio sulfuroxidans]